MHGEVGWAEGQVQAGEGHMLGGSHQYLDFFKHDLKINISVYNASMEFKLFVKNYLLNIYIMCHSFLRSKFFYFYLVILWGKVYTPE